MFASGLRERSSARVFPVSKKVSRVNFLSSNMTRFKFKFTNFRIFYTCIDLSYLRRIKFSLRNSHLHLQHCDKLLLSLRDMNILRRGSSSCNRDLLLPCWGHVNHMVHVTVDTCARSILDRAIEFTKFKLCTRDQFLRPRFVGFMGNNISRPMSLNEIFSLLPCNPPSKVCTRLLLVRPTVYFFFLFVSDRTYD